MTDSKKEAKGGLDGGPGKAKVTDNLRAFVDPKLVAAISHPLRVHILDALGEAIASPSDLARSAGVSVNYVAYHIKELEKIGFIELVRTEPRRGTVEHYYRIKRRLKLDDAEWERLPETAREGFGAGVLRMTTSDMRQSIEANVFCARNGHFSNTRLLLDEEGWDELSSALSEVLDRVLSLKSECEKRLAASGADPIPASVSLFSFVIPPCPTGEEE